MMQRAIVTPIPTTKGASVAIGSSDSDPGNSSNSIWKNRRPHNPSSVPIPLLQSTAPRRKGRRHNNRRRYHDTASSKPESTSTDSSLASHRTLVGMFLFMVACVIMEVILVDCFFFGANEQILHAVGHKDGSLIIIPNKSHSDGQTTNNSTSSSSVTISVISQSIAASTTSTDWDRRQRQGRKSRDTPLPLLT
jgi:hypothetical protein